MAIMAEKNGYTLIMEGTWMELFNKYGILEKHDVAVKEDISKNYLENYLERFIIKHSVLDFPRSGVIKYVAYDDKTNQYIQLQAIRGANGVYQCQEYDDEFVFRKETCTGCIYKDIASNWMKEHYQIQKCLSASVFRCELGDCTNRGISSKAKRLYILGVEGPFYPEDLRTCVTIQCHEVLDTQYINAKPAYLPRYWYMAGGNFLYTSDSRYSQYTGMIYPIAIHDRYEGRQ